MARWRVITLVLTIVALALWAVLFSLNLGPELGHGLPAQLAPRPEIMLLRSPLSGLPGWVSSLALFITLFLAGIANLYLFPGRVRVMSRSLRNGRQRPLVITLVGIGFGLLLLVFAFGAGLARITFPLAILSAAALVFMAVWGFLGAAYALGRELLGRAERRLATPALNLALGLLLLVPLMRIPLVDGLVMIVYMGLGLGLVISTRFGSNEPWSLIPLLEEETE